MTRSLNILMLSKDPTLFSRENTTFGDTRKRHIVYATELLRRHPESEIRTITYTPITQNVQTEKVCDGFRIYGTGSLHRATFLLGLLIRLRSVLADDWRPDVVTVQTPWEEGTLGFFIARCFNAKYLPQLHFDLFSDDWKREHWLNPWRQMVASWLFRNADSIRVVSTVQREKLVGKLGITAGKIQIVPVGVNFVPVDGTKEFYKDKIAAGLAANKVVLFVGRFCHQKNLPLWVEIAEQVSRQIPDAAFVMAGDGDLSEDVKSLVRQKGLEERFHFLGNVGHGQLPEVYAAADLFLLSSHYEGFGRVIVESFLAEVPVVSTACTGPEDIIEHGLTGFLLPIGDCRGLVDAVVHLLQDNELRERFGSRGHQLVAAQFSLEALTGKLITCWENA
jgi:glycosyltransferase involved in cell wall biosynthesis